MNKTEVREIINDELKKFIVNDLDREIKKIMKNSSSQTRTELIDTIKNSIESVYKILWQKRDFWKTDIK